MAVPDLCQPTPKRTSQDHGKLSKLYIKYSTLKYHILMFSRP